MPVGPTTWSVLPHDPLQPLAPNLWRVDGVMSDTNRRVMTLVRLADGRVILHNAVALDEPSMAAIDAWGEVAAILVPNSFHRRDAFIMQARYPQAKVYAPRGAMAAAAKATPVAGTYDDVPTDASVKVRHLAGLGDREGVLVVRSDDGVSAVFCDTVLNLPKMSGIFGFILHPTGMLSVPRPTTWWLAKDLGALRADLQGLAAEGLTRVIPGHGAVVADAASERLKEAAERF